MLGGCRLSVQENPLLLVTVPILHLHILRSFLYLLRHSTANLQPSTYIMPAQGQVEREVDRPGCRLTVLSSESRLSALLSLRLN